jgi:hypothetical protein
MITPIIIGFLFTFVGVFLGAFRIVVGLIFAALITTILLNATVQLSPDALGQNALNLISMQEMFTSGMFLGAAAAVFLIFRMSKDIEPAKAKDSFEVSN